MTAYGSRPKDKKSATQLIESHLLEIQRLLSEVKEIADDFDVSFVMNFGNVTIAKEDGINSTIRTDLFDSSGCVIGIDVVRDDDEAWMPSGGYSCW